MKLLHKYYIIASIIILGVIKLALFLSRYLEVMEVILIMLILYVLYWVVGLVIPIKLPFMTELIKNPKEPVYRLEIDSWGDSIVSEYNVGWSILDEENGVGFICPLVLMFRYKTMKRGKMYEISKSNVEDIKSQKYSPKDIFMKYYNEENKEKLEEDKKKRTEEYNDLLINREYYDNFKERA